MHSKRIYLLGLMALAALMMLSLVFVRFAHAQAYVKGYHEDIRMLKSKGREAIFKAMELHARVAVMLTQGSQDVETMYKLLDQSYGCQADSIGMMERITKSSRFKDPVMLKLIQDMYNWGKPGTLGIKAKISNQEWDSALANLEKVRGLHMQVSTMFY